jgi:hypothetical protein
MLTGVLSTVFMLVPPTDATFPLWNKIFPVFNSLNYPARLLMRLWMKHFSDYPLAGCICTTLTQWLLVGLIVGSAWAYFGGTQKKASA